MTEDEEKVWRTLQNKDGIIPLRCRWGFHRPTIWRVDGEATSNTYHGRRNWREIRMESKCADCGRVKYKVIEKPLV